MVRQLCFSVPIRSICSFQTKCTEDDASDWGISAGSVRDQWRYAALGSRAEFQWQCAECYVNGCDEFAEISGWCGLIA